MATITSKTGYCTDVEGRRILKSGGVGKWSPHDDEELTGNLLRMAKSFAGKKWAYIADPTKMDPIMSKETSAAFVGLHEELEKAGCVAVAFLDGNTAAMKLQSQKHQNNSGSKMEILHCKTEEQAMEWLEKMGI